MKQSRLLVPVLALLATGAAAAQQQEQKPKPVPELDKALAKATVHNKRVLAVLTDEGKDFVAALKKDKVLEQPLLYEFETVQFSGEQAHQLAVRWKQPDALNEKPALVVLDTGGKVLAGMLPGDFLGDDGIAGEQLLGKLKPLFCAPVDAEQKLAAGIAEAKKTGRNVFVRFDAPW